MTRQRKILIIVALVLALLVPYAWTQRERISEELLSALARHFGLQEVALSVSRITSTQIVLAGISFTYELEGGLMMVSIQGAAAKYDLQTLRDGRLYSFDADHVEISVLSGRDPARKSSIATIVNLLRLLGQDTATLLPLDTAIIEAYEFISDDAAEKFTGSLQLRRQAGKVQGQIDVRQGGLTPIRLEFLSEGPGAWDVSIASQDTPTDFLNISIAMSDNQLDVTGQVDIAATPARLMPGKMSGLVDVSGKIDLPVEPDGELGIALNLTAEAVNGGNFTVEELAVSINEGVVSAGDNDLVSVDLLPGSTLRANRIVVDDVIRAEGFSSAFSLSIDSTATDRITIGEDSGFSMEALQVMGTVWPEGLNLYLRQQLLLQSRGDSLRLSVPFIVESPYLRVDYPGYSISSSDVSIAFKQLEIQKTGYKLEGNFSTGDIHLQHGEAGVDLSNINQAFTYIGDVFSANGIFTDPIRDLTLTSALNHRLNDGSGDLLVQSQKVVLTADTPLASYIEPLEIPISIIAGTLDTRLQAHWKSGSNGYELQAGLSLTANSVGGAVNKMLFSGLSMQLDLDVFPEIRTRDVQELRVADIDIGLPVTDLFVKYQLSASPYGRLPTIQLPLLEANVLGGKISATNSHLDPNLSNNEIDIAVRGILLAEVVALHQLEDIEATGVIDGSLPIVISDNGVSVSDGRLYTRDPGGRIAYHADTTALANTVPGSDIVFNALKNFNYTSLQIDPDYDSSGLLMLGLKIQGSNPDLEAGRQINLNINLEQNIIKLLQSLRFVEGLNDAIDSRVQEYYRQLDKSGPG